MNYLSLPSYRFLKDRTDDDANKWKKFILEENDFRGKRALEEKAKRKRRQEHAVRMQVLEARRGMNEDDKIGEENGTNAALEPKPEENGADKSDTLGDGTNEPGPDVQETESEKKIKNEEHSKVGRRTDDSKEDNDTGYNELTSEQKAARNAWRFEPPPNIDNPFAIKRSALKGKGCVCGNNGAILSNAGFTEHFTEHFWIVQKCEKPSM